MQSGISVSEELHSAFKKFITSPEQRGLLCTIVKEALTSYAVLKPASSSFESDLSILLEPTLKNNQNAAFYIILRRYDISSTAPFIVITYIPDAAPVRSKMLFASTRLTLVRELGTERFRETILATTLEELTAEGFRKHDQNVQLDAPLTEKEKNLSEVKNQEVQEFSSKLVRKNCMMKCLHMPASDEVISALTELGKNDFDTVTTERVNLVQLQINLDTETLEIKSKSTVPISKLSSSISNTTPCFSFYRYTHTHNGVISSPILFIYTCPVGSRLKERMLYAASSRSVHQLAEQDIGLQISKKIEESNPTDITEEIIYTELHPQAVEVTKPFNRPRKPGRGVSREKDHVGTTLMK